MEIIKYLGDIIARRIGISPTAARGLLKLSIKDELGPFTDFETINYENLYRVICRSLKKRLVKLEISFYEEIIRLMIDELTKNQSLITMGGV
ncbi:MAG: hypothetical protein JW891_16870 [Candidatus Lokiarchaeota archaeon]|nr:hypothetical protein [Candidatus Lokiarchaeota archaeon]